MGEEFDLVRVVQKVAKWLGKGLVVDAHVVACEDADKDAGRRTCAQWQKWRRWSRPSRAASNLGWWGCGCSWEFLCLYKNQMFISLIPASNLWGVIFLAVLYASCCQAIEASTNEYAWAHIEHNQEHAKNKVDGQTMTVDKYLDLLLSSSTRMWQTFRVSPTVGQQHVFLHMERRNCFRHYHQR